MDNKISTQAKVELVGVLGQRYRESSKMTKTQILDEFIAVVESRIYDLYMDFSCIQMTETG